MKTNASYSHESVIHYQDIISTNSFSIQTIDVNQLKQVEYYAREQIQGQEKVIKNSLSKYQMKIPIVVNRRANGELVIVDGVGRWKVWKELGNTEIEVLVLEETEEKEKELHVYLNRQASQFDMELLLTALEDLNPEDFGLECIDEEEFDDKDFHDKSTKNWKENNGKTIRRMRFNFKGSDYFQIKEDFQKIKSELGLTHDSEMFQWFIEKYNEDNKSK